MGKRSLEFCEKLRQANLGKTHSPETRAKMSRSHAGIQLSNEHREKISRGQIGRNFKTETREKIGQALLGIKRTPESKEKNRRTHLGEKNRNWRGGITKEKYATGFNRELKYRVRTRDGFSCSICGVEEGEWPHDVHHIDYKKSNHDLINLITLCHSCHVKTNFRREAWLLYFGRS
jgi:hypothetical protein